MSTSVSTARAAKGAKLYQPSTTSISTTPPSSRSSLYEDDACTDGEDNVLTAYGDISLSNVDFVPGLPSELPPPPDPEWIRFEVKARKGRHDRPTAPKKVRKRIPGAQYAHPVGGHKSQLSPPSPTDKTDFEILVETIRTGRAASERSTVEEREKENAAIREATKKILHDTLRASFMKSLRNAGGNQSDSKWISDKEAAKEEPRGLVKKIAMTPSDYAVVKGPSKPLRTNAKLHSRPPIPTWN